MRPVELSKGTVIAESTGIKAERTLAYRLFEVDGRYVWRCCNPPMTELDSPTFDSVDAARESASCQGWTVQELMEPQE
jgi:hypothetical protein